ncbi:RagB/SusD family nutrient uptake outer membrane protein [Fulvivirga ligni]|uniref:RagB/SusD family nutrient uptake outer membrane protein n=1 Tax=Fulvivirga ligni TaxID=2904246 RepID=UPI001F274E28|nr:RagB/SusD family nutrient uptake outer membrane protein [Fulvivirga ligni]UII18954.1 RagB/SusD family nutrient uptake outer membrane protein [Fulvivirga ligni]
MNIKKYTEGSLLTLIILAFAVACTPDLDVEPRNKVTDASVWVDPTNADLFLNDVYQQMPDMNTVTQDFDQYADNSYVGADWFPTVSQIYQAALSPSGNFNGPADMWNWGLRYTMIRRANIFIENVTASTELSDEYKVERLAEARFLRALSYHWLWMAYGGVPIITDVLDINADGDDVLRPRETEEATFQFMVDELEAIADDLPNTRSGKDLGRPTKGSALTLKGWIELFHASPQRNTSNDPARWQAAAATNMQVMNLGVYALFNDFGGIWLPENNNNIEVIFDYQVSPTKGDGGAREGMLGPAFVNGVQQSWANFAPTQELVDDFAMENGKPISDPTSGYDPQNPYKNREERFYKTIVYDGSVWQGDTIYTRMGVGSLNEIDLSSASDVSNTGYYARKTLDESVLGQDNLANRNGGQNFIWFRYADVLLNYAEAQNEAVGPDASVYDAVNQVRNRSSLPDLESGLSREEMRVAIHRERRVEFAFEGKRWWDIIRWKRADGPDGLLNQPMHGMKIERVDGELTYTPVVVTDRTFLERMYLMPIPIDAINRNGKLTPNPGYQ